MPAPHTANEQDHADKLLEQWRQVRPELDCSPMAFFGRLSRMALLAEREIVAVIKQHGLTAGEFDVLAALRKNAAPLTPTELYQSTLLTSGAMTARLDKLEQRGLITRQHSQKDRRSMIVQLTAEGMSLVDTTVDAHVANEQQLITPLTAEEQQLLTGLMRRWLLAHE
ncbi:MarR family transcriptional regulator [Shewanella sp. A3A]|nr:MarR family transcriptional regulator [Shewanella ferrihydritica]